MVHQSLAQRVWVSVGFWVNLSKNKLFVISGMNFSRRKDFFGVASFLSSVLVQSLLSFWAFSLVLILEEKILGCILFLKLEEGWRCGIINFCLLKIGWFFWILFYPTFSSFSFLLNFYVDRVVSKFMMRGFGSITLGSGILVLMGGFECRGSNVVRGFNANFVWCEAYCSW